MVENVRSKITALMRPRRQERQLIQKLRPGLEMLRKPRGVFVAASGEDYNACWIRDQLYSTYAYYFLGEEERFVEGIRVVFKILEASRARIERALCVTPERGADFIHAKYHADELCEITDEWGHHQIDALGLFLFLVGRAEHEGIQVVTTLREKEMLQLLVLYLAAVRYFGAPDNGMWEEGLDLHSSSIGAAVAGLREIKRASLAIVPEYLIERGAEKLFELLPYESPSREVDLAQLSLLWPYDIVPKDLEDIILKRVKEKLVQRNGINRYWGDNYYRSSNGISAEWTMGFFWLSLIYAKREEWDEARYWFDRGMETMTPEGYLPELYQDGKPNLHTPLAWAHSLAIIAALRLRIE